MIEYGLPVVFALFIWWFSTGIILFLDRLPHRSFRWSMLAATVLLAVALYGVWASSDDASVSGAFAGFTCGLLIWGWHEMSFLMGLVTGSRTTPCPQDASGMRRFACAIQTILYHELAIAATAGLIVYLTWEGANQTATWTFVILWLMRLSTKLNIFLGVPNLTEEFLPAHLHYLKSYFKKAAINPLFPISVTISTIITVLLAQNAVQPGASAFQASSFAFLATLMALAVLEHWFLVLPLPDAALWNWALKPQAAEEAGGRDDGRLQKMPRLKPVKLLAETPKLAENEAEYSDPQGLYRFYSSIGAHRAPIINWR